MNRIQGISVILLAISTIITAMINIQQIDQIGTLQKQVRCLEMGHEYLFGTRYCADIVLSKK